MINTLVNEELTQALLTWDEERVAIALRAGADPNWLGTNGLAPLHTAAGDMFEAGVELLLQAGADPNTPDGNGRTPLHHAACMVDGEQPMGLLLIAGSDPSKTDETGRTALHEAAEAGNAGVAAALVRAGAPIDAQDRSGHTALHRASIRFRESTVIALLTKADPLLVDRRGRTALHWAARGNYYDMASALMEAGADPYARDARGMQPIEMALGTLHSYGVKAALAFLDRGVTVPPSILEGMLRNVVRRATYVEGSTLLISVLIRCGVSLNVLTARDFSVLLRNNQRDNAWRGSSGFTVQTVRALRFLANNGCRLPTAVLVELF